MTTFEITLEELKQGIEIMKNQPKPEITKEQKENTPQDKCPHCYWGTKHSSYYKHLIK
jgi:hypothetical protein